MVKKKEMKNSLKTLKFRNRRLVLSFMRKSGAVSVNEISRETGLSKMTVHKIIDHYLKEGMISNAGKGGSTEEGGKKPNLFIFNACCRYIYTVRVGDRYLATSIVNLKGEMMVGRRRVPLDNTPFEQAVEMMAKAYHEQIEEGELAEKDCLAAVVGCNGIVDVENGVCLAAYQYPHWGTNLPIRESLRKHLPEHIPVHVDSWWRHLVHGEMYRTEERTRFFALGNSGDYISGGMVEDGYVSQGKTGFAGEIGHLIVSPGSKDVCVCGASGCLAAVASPRRILEKALAMQSEYPGSRVFDSGLGGGLLDIGRAADAGDELAVRLLDGIAEYFAIAINNIVLICDPGLIVLFGDFTNLGEYFLEVLSKRSDNMTLHRIDKRTRVEYSRLNEEHGEIGAANRVTDSLFSGSIQ